MKKISLNKARKYEDKLKKFSKYISVHTKFNIFDPNISAPVIKNELGVKYDTEFLPNLEKIKSSISYRYTLRRLIQEANDSCGISELLTKHNEANQFVSMLIDIIDEIEPMLELGLNDPEVIMGMIKNQSEHNNSYGNAINGLVLNAGDVKGLKEPYHYYKAVICKCDDELELLNATTQIEIDEDLYKFISELI